VRQTIATIDEVIIVAEPDLANRERRDLDADRGVADGIGTTSGDQPGWRAARQLPPTNSATSVECKLLGRVGSILYLRHGRR